MANETQHNCLCLIIIDSLDQLSDFVDQTTMNENKSTNLSAPSSWVRAIAESLETYDVDVAEVFRQAGIDYAKVSDSTSHYYQDALTQLWNLATQQSNDPNFGLKTGLRIHAHSYPTISYSLMACKNLQASCERLVRYQQLLAEGFQFELQDLGPLVRLGFDILPSSLPPSVQASDGMLSSFLNFIGWLTQYKVKPTKATLKRECPKDTSLFDEIFACPIEYQSSGNYLFFSHEDMLFRLPTADANISKIHDANANRVLAQSGKSDLSTRVRDKLMEHLPSGEPKQEHIASELNVSSSTLKRRLQAEGDSFKDLLDKTREELAESYLESGAMNLTEITYLLGFSENSAFTRAFKRWKNVTPSQWLKSSSPAQET